MRYSCALRKVQLISRECVFGHGGSTLAALIHPDALVPKITNVADAVLLEVQDDFRGSLHLKRAVGLGHGYITDEITDALLEIEQGVTR